MYKYIKAYELGYNEGIKDALNYKKNKKFKIIDDKSILSKLYDIGYIEGYTKFVKIINSSLNKEKSIV